MADGPAGRSGVAMQRSIDTQLFEWPSGDPHLIGSECRSCGVVSFPRQAGCPRCCGSDVGPRRSGMEQGVVAARAALADAGISWKDVQYAFGGSSSAGNADTMVSRLGLTGLPFINVANGCATGGSALLGAYMALSSGQADVALAVGFDKHEPGRFGGKAITLRAACIRTRNFGSFEVFSPSLALQRAQSPSVMASRAAYEMAGVGPEDVDVAQLQDTESGAEIMHMAENGFCQDG